MDHKVTLACRTRDNLLERMYELLHKGKLNKGELPHSTVYYVREALKARTGVLYTFKQIAMAIHLHEQRYPRQC